MSNANAAAFDAIHEKYVARRQEIEDLQQQQSAIVGKVFKEGFQTLVSGPYPFVEGIKWHQYTPHFNDGDVCTFSVDTYGVTVLVRRDPGAEPVEVGDYTDEEAAPSEQWAIEDARKFLEMFQEQDLLSLFGDHVEITVARDGSATTATCEHD